MTPNPINCHHILGQPPPGWDRDVIFFANILAIFYGNSEETQNLQNEVGTIATYGSRLVPILNFLFKGSHNCLVLEKNPPEILMDYFRNDLDLSIPSIKILKYKDYQHTSPSNINKDSTLHEFYSSMLQHSAIWIDGFVTDQTLETLAQLMKKRTMCSYTSSHRGNNKFLLYQEKKKQNLPTFDTVITSSPNDIPKALDELSQQGYRKAVIKSQIGASGVGMFRVSTNDQSAPIPNYAFNEGPCLVQGWLDESIEAVRYIGSPSVQMFLNDTDLYLYDLTEQLLSRQSIHEGNVSPPEYLRLEKDITNEILHQSKVMGQWLHNQGYRGTASSDFHLIQRNGKPEVRLCEINARVTGATYPSVLAQNFNPEGAWLMRNICFSPAVDENLLMATLRQNELLYHKKNTQGILPFNLNFDHKGKILKGQFLFLGPNTQTVWLLLEHLINLDSLNGQYDRD